ncbi:MAG: ATPase [Thermoplasmatales archaeon]|nr:ATPase [Thermoplasmatales archaeon]
MAMKFQDNEIAAGWEAVLAKDDYRLQMREVQSRYPDKKSIEVRYADLDAFNPDLALYILENPDLGMRMGKKALMGLMPSTWDPTDVINLRLRELPKDVHVEVRDLRAKHLGKLVSVSGLVRKATLPKPRLTKAVFRCSNCGLETTVVQEGMYMTEPSMCANEGCNKRALRFIPDLEASEYIDTQKVEVQENPEGLRGGAQPERITGFIEDDISGHVAPGNRVTMNGIIKSAQKTERDKTTVFEIHMDVMSVESDRHEYDEIEITPEDERKIIETSRDPALMDNIVKSISPTIFGLEREKEAVALQLFGGSHKEMDDGTTIRGDIHILLIGDPGVAKSQLLRYMSGLAPRGIYASGKSASAAGLCVHPDTAVVLEKGTVPIGKFVESHADGFEEYRPGIWRRGSEGHRALSLGPLGSMRLSPVTHVWRIKTPERLVRVTVEDGRSLTLTPETKMMAYSDCAYGWVEAKDMAVGDCAMMGDPHMRPANVVSVEFLDEGLPEYVYDLTVDQSHSFVGNGFIVHNTAAAVKDDFGDGRWTLEAGALVLADMGLACIDELDKMSPQDRSSLHEAMESQRISVAKAGITATLQCRCSMLAAANPKYGRFDENEKIAAQIDLPPALMSRFDMIFVLTDKPDRTRDRNITEHILAAHTRGQVRMAKPGDIDEVTAKEIMERTDSIKPVYDEDFLRKYVAYSKRIIPVMTEEAKQIIENDYLSIRGMGDGSNASVPITARQLEAYVRLSEASARARLSNRVEAQDANRAVGLVRYYLEKIAGTADGTYDIDRVASEFTSKDRSNVKAIRSYIVAYNSEGGVNIEELKSICAEDGIGPDLVDKEVERLSNIGEIYKTSEGRWRMV